MCILATRRLFIFVAKCYRHGGNEYNVRARLEDLLEIEKRRAGKAFARVDAPMTFSHASRLLHSAIGVLRVLGWAWRWAEMCVDYDSSWEPLLEPGEREEDMTKEQLKIVDSTRESRCEDARKCRLAAFGAALRNRDYDSEDDYDRKSFRRALRAILETKSLVGPLEEIEVEFFIRWLSLAYWSKSELLRFGENKIEVSEKCPTCVHVEDGSPKHVLGSRLLPGKRLIADSLKGEAVSETDDFMRREIVTDEILAALRAARKPSEGRRSPRKPRQIEKNVEEVDEVVSRPKKKKKKGRGRPPKRSLEDAASQSPSKKKRGRKPKPKVEDVIPNDGEANDSLAPSPSKERSNHGPERRTDSPGGTPVPKRGRGRPRKVKVEDSAASEPPSAAASTEATEGHESHAPSTPKRRPGRPPKKKADVQPSSDPNSSTDVADAAIGSSDPATHSRRHRRSLQVAPVERTSLAASIYAVVKRRKRKPTDRLGAYSSDASEYEEEYDDEPSGVGPESETHDPEGNQQQGGCGEQNDGADSSTGSALGDASQTTDIIVPSVPQQPDGGAPVDERAKAAESGDNSNSDNKNEDEEGNPDRAVADGK